MFPFKNASIFQFNPDVEGGAEQLIAMAQAQRHQLISDEAPTELVCGWGSYSPDEDAFSWQHGAFLMLRFVIESRGVDARLVNKELSKRQAVLERGGKLLDMDQQLLLTAEIRREHLAKAVSFFAVVHVLFDFEAGHGMISSTSKCEVTLVRGAVNLLADDIRMSFNTMVSESLQSHFTRWVGRGDIGTGLMLGGDVKANFDKCKLSLNNADLTTDFLINLLKFFDVNELSFSGHLVTDAGYSHRYLAGGMKASGQFMGLAWLLDNDVLEQVGDRADYDQAHFAAHCDLWRQFIGQLMINVLSLSVDDAPDYIQAVFKRSCPPGGAPISADVDHVLYRDVVQFVLEQRRCSISGLQRQFKIGYDTAARLVNELERQQVIAPADEDGVRQVLIAQFVEPEAVD